jgi:hypothetical protein
MAYTPELRPKINIIRKGEIIHVGNDHIGEGL